MTRDRMVHIDVPFERSRAWRAVVDLLASEEAAGRCWVLRLFGMWAVVFWDTDDAEAFEELLAESTLSYKHSLVRPAAD